MGTNTVPEATPGNGRWIHLSVDNTVDLAPNAVALGAANKKVGEALKDINWNGIGGFPTDDLVRTALFTAANKIGVMELNRPEEVEWNPLDVSGKPRLYVAFTNHTGCTALDEQGKLIPAATHCDGKTYRKRADRVGSIMVIDEATPTTAATSKTFKFWTAWRGAEGSSAYAAAAPDNLLIDAEGGVWFGTDGNFGVNKTGDALYYLDLDPAHKEGPNATYGKAFRVAQGPSDSEATGPTLSSDGKTLFFGVQHPGEDQFSTYPRGR